jgi:hypothetical protein
MSYKGHVAMEPPSDSRQSRFGGRSLLLPKWCRSAARSTRSEVILTNPSRTALGTVSRRSPQIVVLGTSHLTSQYTA